MTDVTREGTLSLTIPAGHRAYVLAETREMFEWEKGWLEEEGCGPEDAPADVMEERFAQMDEWIVGLDQCADRISGEPYLLMRFLRTMFAHLTDELEGAAGNWRKVEIDTATVRAYAKRLQWACDAYDALPSIPESWIRTEAVA